MKVAQAALANGTGNAELLRKSAQYTVLASNTSTVAGVVRISSIIVASESPFVVEVKNSAGTFTTYKVQGQKPTKITLSRETSVGGNAALFKSFTSGSATSGDAVLVRIADNADVVDAHINIVVDGSLDD